MTQACVVFDFDGTLVDSAPGILSGIAHALAECNIEPRIPLVKEIIGPPLAQTLALASGTETPSLLQDLATRFKRFYDTDAYRGTLPYPDVDDVLQELKRSGIQMHIATNKRGLPTRLILEHLGWASLFESVYCLDEHPDCADKPAMLAKLVKDHSLSRQMTAYVGDTEGDAFAAKFNQLPFLHAAWGYGQGCTYGNTDISCSSARVLPAAIRQRLEQGTTCPAS